MVSIGCCPSIVARSFTRLLAQCQHAVQRGAPSVEASPHVPAVLMGHCRCRQGCRTPVGYAAGEHDVIVGTYTVCSRSAKVCHDSVTQLLTHPSHCVRTQTESGSTHWQLEIAWRAKCLNPATAPHGKRLAHRTGSQAQQRLLQTTQSTITALPRQRNFWRRHHDSWFFQT